MNNLYSYIIDTFFPKYCVGCSAVDFDICPECKSKLIFIKKPRCIRCLKNSSDGKTCAGCKKFTAVDQLVSAVYYDEGPAREAVHKYKYDGRASICGEILAIMNECVNVTNLLDQNRTKNWVITEVPLFFTRRWGRGFNQSEIMAKRISRKYGLQYIALLKRTKSTIPQHKMHRAERWANVEKLYQVRGGVSGKTIVLIDDVVTTGATLNACAKVLKQAGAKKVVAITFARAI